MDLVAAIFRYFAFSSLPLKSPLKMRVFPLVLVASSAAQLNDYRTVKGASLETGRLHGSTVVHSKMANGQANIPSNKLLGSNFTSIDEERMVPLEQAPDGVAATTKMLHMWGEHIPHISSLVTLASKHQGEKLLSSLKHNTELKEPLRLLLNDNDQLLTKLYASIPSIRAQATIAFRRKAIVRR